jgi:hypothetical protein
MRTIKDGTRRKKRRSGGRLMILALSFQTSRTRSPRMASCLLRIKSRRNPN